MRNDGFMRAGDAASFYRELGVAYVKRCAYAGGRIWQIEAIKSDAIHELRKEHQCMHVHKECHCSNNGLKIP
jgi:hypothetical protein